MCGSRRITATHGSACRSAWAAFIRWSSCREGLMPVDSTATFRWLSPLGVSVILFLLITFMYVLMGIVSPILHHMIGLRFVEWFGLVWGKGADTQAYGRPPEVIAREHPEILATRVLAYDMLGGLYLCAAILHFCAVWFGLREGRAWALWALTLADLAIVAYYLIAGRLFSAAVTPVTLGDMHPYALFPALILP